MVGRTPLVIGANNRHRVVGFLGWRALGVGVVLRFIYLFLVWESWDTGFWRRVFLDFFDCFWGKGGGLVLDLVFF